MIDFVNLTLKSMNCEQLGILQAAVRIAGDNLTVLYQKEILSEDYVAAYSDFFKELGNELTSVQDILFGLSNRDSVSIEYAIDCAHLSVGCDPCEKGGETDEN